MDANRVAWNIGGWKKGEPHNVIPMHMGHEEVIDLGCAWPVVAHDLLPKTAQPRAHIAYHVLCAAYDVHTGGVATVAVSGREIEFRINETLHSLVAVEASTVGLEERLLNFVTHPCAGEGNWNGSARSPKTYAHSSSVLAEGASCPLPRQPRCQAQDIPGPLALIGDVIHQRADERNPQATDLTLGCVNREVRSGSGQDIAWDTSVDELNEKVLRLIPRTADDDLAVAVGIGIEANIRQGLFDGEFDLRDALGGKALSSST